MLSPQRSLRLDAELGWTHEFAPTSSLHAAFVESPAIVFPVDGVEAASNTADLHAGVAVLDISGVLVSAGISAELSSRLSAVAGTVELAKSW